MRDLERKPHEGNVVKLWTGSIVGEADPEIQSYLSFCMASGQGVRLCIMGGYSFSEVCIPELYYISKTVLELEPSETSYGVLAA